MTRARLLVGLLIGSLAAHLWTFWRVLRPVGKLSAQARRLAAGDLAALETSCGGAESVRTVQQAMVSMAGHVQRAQSEGLTYRHALTDGQEAERARIAHDLHDETVQSFIAIAHSLDLAAAWLERDPARAQAMLTAARAQAVESVGELRRLIADLRPPALEELGLPAALRMLAETEHDGRVTVKLHGAERRIGAAHELALFRIAQEAVRNAERHGQARTIAIDLTFARSRVKLAVTDDGRGFQPDQITTEQRFGLVGMRERAEQMRGSLIVTSRPGAGTRVEVVLPLDAGAQPSERARDPVCGAVIEPQRAYGSTLYDGQRYYFCCPVCQGAFQREPARYVGTAGQPV